MPKTVLHVEIVCKNCKRVFHCYPSHAATKRYCSLKCRNEYSRNHPELHQYWSGKKHPEVKQYFTMRGRQQSEEFKRMLSKKFKGRAVPLRQRLQISKTLMGHPANPGSGRGRSGYREDGNYYRSRWEANVARTFAYEGIDFLYELMRLNLGNCTYVPDFYLPQFDMFVEVKGYVDDTARRKIGQFALWALRNTHGYIVMTKPLYEQLSAIYATKLDGWEQAPPR